MSVMVDDPDNRSTGVFEIVMRVLLVSLVAMIGGKILLPGLDPTLLAAQFGNGDASRLAIFAVGVGPAMTALALGQIVRLVAPQLDKSTALLIVENVVALLLGFSQAAGIAQSLSTMGFLVDDSAFVYWVIVASLVGGVAISLVLARLVALPGLVAGLWIVWVLPALIGLPGEVSSSFDLLRTGAADGGQLLLVLLVILIGVALSWFAAHSVMRVTRERTDFAGIKKHVHVLNVVVWPPLLAAIAGSYLLTPLAYIAPFLFENATLLNIYTSGIMPVLIVVFVFGYRRFFSNAGVTMPVSVALVVAVTQIALLLGGGFVTRQMLLPLPLSSTTLLVLVTVIYALVDAIRRPSVQAN